MHCDACPRAIAPPPQTLGLWRQANAHAGLGGGLGQDHALFSCADCLCAICGERAYGEDAGTVIVCCALWWRWGGGAQLSRQHNLHSYLL